MLDISANIFKVIHGTSDIVYDKVYISRLQIDTRFGESVVAMVEFSYYRNLEDGTRELAPINIGTAPLTIPDLNQVLDMVEGGASLKDGVESAFITLGKAYGII